MSGAAQTAALQGCWTPQPDTGSSFSTALGFFDPPPGVASVFPSLRVLSFLDLLPCCGGPGLLEPS